MTDKELKQQLTDTVSELYQAGLITGKGGNVSVRSVDHKDAVWITPSRIFKGGLKSDHMILVNMEGERLEGEMDPSVESAYHSGIMKLRQEINCVVHTHAPLATIFGLIDIPMLPITAEAVFIMDFPKLPFFLAGSTELTRLVLENLGQTRLMGAYLINHGLITMGKDLQKATELTYTVEFVLKLLFTVRNLNSKPSLLPETDVEQLRKISNSIYG